MTIGLFFSTTGGATKQAAQKIQEYFGNEDVELFDIDETAPSRLSDYQKLIFGAPTMGNGELSDEWESWMDALGAADLRGKTIALFGLGDQDGYPDTFVDALGIIRDQLVEWGATVVGAWPVDGYDYSDSKAEQSGAFVGLVIDDDNQPQLTDERIRRWVEGIRKDLE